MSNTASAEKIEFGTTPSAKLMTFEDMLPGDHITRPVLVSNDSDVTLRYAVRSSATNVDGKGLRDELEIAIRGADETVPSSCDEFDGVVLYAGELGNLNQYLFGANDTGTNIDELRILRPDMAETLCFRVTLPIDVGDAYQGSTTTVTFDFVTELWAG